MSPAPIIPETLQNVIHTRSYTISSDVPDIYLQPFSDLRPKVASAPHGWSRCITPEGQPYFWHKDLNLYTNVHLTRGTNQHSEVVSIIEHAANHCRRCFATRQDTDEAKPDLVIAQLRERRAGKHSGPEWGYYFASSKRRTVFWVDPIRLADIIAGCPRSVPTNDHLNLIREAQYWYHVQMFPAGHVVEPAVISELSGLLACAYTDTITSTTSTSPYSTEKLRLISRVLDTVKEGQDVQTTWTPAMPMPLGDVESVRPDGEKSAQTAWIVARFMSVFKRDMFLHYYGQDGARLNRNQSVRCVERPRPRYIFLLVSSFLFYMPYVYKKKLDEVFVDTLLNEEHWMQFLDSLRKDWELTVTPSTVLLGANVVFLAISSIDSASQAPHWSPGQIMIYVSTVLNLASYLVCWILLQRHAPHIGSSTLAGIIYLKRREQCVFGLEADAVVFSLPSAFFTWSMLVFCAAIVWTCLAKSNLATRLIVAAVLAVIAFSLVVVLQVSWVSIAPTEDNVWRRNVEFVRYVRERSIDALAGGLLRRMSWTGDTPDEILERTKS
ncbi:hypothetical protein PsYK624_101840 [Phanerochaete sordida]|uniref:WW domain-containing protein n=1 Tax=Phanerochaete sordida TaxID=48140 RepID=A0A9P3LFY7_9APHY|nr:hypothetical protein PsYK624_101840 [Phanerochaete sordida]